MQSSKLVASVVLGAALLLYGSCGGSENLSLWTIKTMDQDGNPLKGAIITMVSTTGQTVKVINSDDAGSATLVPNELPLGEYNAIAEWPGYLPTYAKIDNRKPGKQLLGFIMRPTLLNHPSQSIPEDSEATTSHKGFGLRDFEIVPSPVTHLHAEEIKSGRAIVDIVFVRGNLEEDLEMTRRVSVETRSTDAIVMAVDPITLQTIWTGGGKITTNTLVAMLPRDKLSAKFNRGLWLVTVASVPAPSEQVLHTQTHDTTASDCHSGGIGNRCEQQTKFMMGGNECGNPGGGSITLSWEVSLSFGLNIDVFSATVEGSISAGYTGNIPGNSRMDFYLVVRGCTWLECASGWDCISPSTKCSSGSLAQSCGDGGWACCAGRGAAAHAVKSDSCSRQSVASHRLSC